MNFKVLLLFVDYYLYPLARKKHVKYRAYECGLANLLRVIDPLKNTLDIETHLFLTGGSASSDHTLLFDYVHDSLENSLQDFSGYLAAALHVDQSFCSSTILPVFCNSSCPPVYLQILLQCLRGFDPPAHHIRRQIIAPSFSFLFRDHLLWRYQPHFQSYCFYCGQDYLKPLISFIESCACADFTRKKDYIRILEIGLSHHFLSKHYSNVYRASKSGIKPLSFLSALKDNPFAILDTRLAPAPLDFL